MMFSRLVRRLPLAKRTYILLTLLIVVSLHFLLGIRDALVIPNFEKYASYQNNTTIETYDDNDSNIADSVPAENETSSTILARQNFSSELFHILKDCMPPLSKRSSTDELFTNGKKCELVEDSTFRDTSIDRLSRKSYDTLSGCVHIAEPYKSEMRAKHSAFVEKIKTLPTTLPESLYANDKGIVTVGGGKFSVILVTMLATLRERNTTLPVEILIPEEDENDKKDFCIDYAPMYNAKCIYMSSFLKKDVMGELAPSRFAYKPFAILLSSFKNVVFIDADSYALKTLDNVLDSKPYKNYGLITWPDIWRRAISPEYYDISGISYNLKKRVRWAMDDISPPTRYEKEKELADPEYLKNNVPFHDLEGTIPDLSSESGQLLINKISHFDTLLLSIYYNVFGLKWYYRLFSQGNSGEGDKDTYVAAAHALKNSYYQVKQSLSFSAYSHNNEFAGVGLLQHDFEEDYNLYTRASTKVKSNLSDYSKFDEFYNCETSFLEELMRDDEGNDSSIMFLHASFFKFEPLTLFREKCYMNDGKHVRGFEDQKTRYNGWDFELFNFNHMYKVFCNDDPLIFDHFEKKIASPSEYVEVCGYLESHIKYLRENPANN